MKHMRIYISKNGDINLLDPNTSIEHFIKALTPNFKPNDAALKDHTPFLMKVKNRTIGISKKELKKLPSGQLKGLHDSILSKRNSNSHASDSATLLDLKIEIAKRELKNCQLCGNNCRVDRFMNRGKCNLGCEAYFSSAYVHLAEEPIINPSIAINLTSSGCGLDCCFCQSKGISETNRFPQMLLNEKLWQRIQSDMDRAATIEFAGGSPDENVLGILEFLSKAPQRLLPIVSNCHSYANEIAYRLWDGVVDIYVADFKFGNDKCGDTLADVKDYVHVAMYGLNSMLKQFFTPKVIVRLLVLPTHVECCALQILRELEPFKDKILLNVMAQYVPEYKILKGFHPELNRRIQKDEIEAVLSEAKKQGFTVI